MSEQNITQCKICKEMKLRIFVGKFDHKNKKWSDESGKLWSGKICPSCNVERSKFNMRKLRNKI